MIQILDGDGTIAWSGPDGESPSHRLAAMRTLLGDIADADVQRSDVLRKAEELEFVSRKGVPRGFLTILPRGTVLQSRVETFNRPHLDALGAVRIDVPIVYDVENAPNLRNLTQSYESQNRVFHLETPSNEWRLAYAADPNLLAYLEGRVLDPSRLPYAIASPMEVFRLLQTGECSGLERNRQYHLPDIHILCGDDARQTFGLNLALAAKGAQFWDPEAVLFIDVVEDFLADWPTLGTDLARIVGCPTHVRTRGTRPRYYEFKAGLVLHTGYGLVMLYNFQWDETNPTHFGLRRSDGGDVVIIHATLAGGWPKLLPWAIGRGLCGVAPMVIPPELDSPELTILPVRNEHVRHAHSLASELAGQGRDVQVDDRDVPLGGKVRQLRQRWAAHHVVIGDREVKGSTTPLVESPAWGVSPCPLPAFLATMGPRFDRCQARIRCRPLPFVGK